MYYIFGDIHGCLPNLLELFGGIKGNINDNDRLIFLGDYIDRGIYSFEVIKFLININKNYDTVFLKGNHEDMFLKYMDGADRSGLFLDNGGRATLRSYKRNRGEFNVPEDHMKFFRNLKSSFEGEDFISVHAGFNPKIYNMEEQSEDDMLWIRDSFYRAVRRWEKTVIFGHTPTGLLGKRTGAVYFDGEKNIIGIDTGAVYGGVLTCLRWPDRKIFQC
ncbi:MAG: serine/threonine protein phosphatase [Spirochaetes bacterium]|nr:serine/threonine protein phosphatase [Spirochaetota bacterium]